MADFLHKEPCPECGSRDNLARYSDGSATCFGLTCEHWEPPTDGSHKPPTKSKRGGRVNFIQGEVRRLRSRKITRDTAQKFGYQCAKTKKGPVQVAPYHDERGKLVAQKVRTENKDFFVIGDINAAMPFGAKLWPKTGKKIVVTEGEIDAMAMSQAQGNSWPVVSIPSGAGKQLKTTIARHVEYYRGFDEVVIMFDSDDVGRKAAEVAAGVIGFDKARIATLPLKDPGEMIEAGRTKELLDAMWRAKPFSPEGIVDLADLKDQVKERPREGLSWCFPALTKLTYGKRLGELYAMGAGTGVGKTDFITQDIRHMIEIHGEKVGVFALEQSPNETGVRLIGKLAETPLHIPEYWDDELFDETWDRWISSGQIFLYNSFGVNTWDSIKAMIKFLHHAHGVKWFYLDHITAMAASIKEDERKALDKLMAELGSLVKELDINVVFISHLATPDGTPHEEGGRVKIRHFRGSRAIGFWSHFMFGMERDQQHEDPTIRQTTTFRVLKDRYTGRATGEVFYLGYGRETGMLYETQKPTEAQDHGFPVDDPLTDTAETNTDF